MHGVGVLSLKDELFSKALEESPKQRHQRLEQAERAGEVLVDASWMFSGNCFLALQSHEISPPKWGLWLSLLPQSVAGGRVLDTREGSPYPWKTSYLLWTESLDTHPQIFMPKHYDSNLNYPHKIMFEYLTLSFRPLGRLESLEEVVPGWQCYITEGGFEGYIYWLLSAFSFSWPVCDHTSSLSCICPSTQMELLQDLLAGIGWDSSATANQSKGFLL